MVNTDGAHPDVFTATSRMMPVRHRVAVAAFVVVTGFIWVQRLVNLATGDESDPVVSVVLSAVLLTLAVAAGVGLVTVAAHQWTGPTTVVATVWRTAAVVTIGVWAVRATQIIIDWRSPGFVVVHVVLAVVSALLALGLWRASLPQH